jgi:hypothetical protein
MHPLVGLALADVFEAEAQTVVNDGWTLYGEEPLVRLARLYLGRPT